MDEFMHLLVVCCCWLNQLLNQSLNQFPYIIIYNNIQCWFTKCSYKIVRFPSNENIIIFSKATEQAHYGNSVIGAKPISCTPSGHNGLPGFVSLDHFYTSGRQCSTILFSLPTTCSTTNYQYKCDQQIISTLQTSSFKQLVLGPAVPTAVGLLCGSQPICLLHSLLTTLSFHLAIAK